MNKITLVATWLIVLIFALFTFESIRPGFASAWVDLHWLWVITLVALLVSVSRSTEPVQTESSRWSAPLSALLVSAALLYPLLRWGAPLWLAALLAFLSAAAWWFTSMALAQKKSEFPH